MGGGSSWNDHVVLWGVGQMTMFDHDGGRGVKIPANLTTWYMDAPMGRCSSKAAAYIFLILSESDLISIRF